MDFAGSAWHDLPGFTTLRVAVNPDSRCGLVELARPSKLNSLSVDSWTELPQAANLLSERHDIAVVVAAGQGRHFCAGIDVSMLTDIAGSMDGGCPGHARQALKQKILKMQDAFTAFERCRWPVIGAIRGACIGAGINLAAACDLRLCTQDAVFSVKEIDLGITADIGILQRLGPIVGHGTAVEWSLTARKVTGKEAESKGFVSTCYPSSTEMQKGLATLVAELACKPKLALLGTKQILLHARDHPDVNTGLDYVATWNSAFLHSTDLQQRLAALQSSMKHRSKM